MSFLSWLFKERTARTQEWDGSARWGDGRVPEAKKPDDITSVWFTGNGTFEVAVVGPRGDPVRLERVRVRICPLAAPRRAPPLRVVPIT